MEFQKDAFEDDNDLSRLEEEEEVGHEAEEVMESEEEEILVTEEAPAPAPAARQIGRASCRERV